MFDNTYILDTRVLLEIGGILGLLSGLVTFLLRQLIKAKDEQIKDLHEAQDRLRDTLTAERDFWRDAAQHLQQR